MKIENIGHHPWCAKNHGSIMKTISALVLLLSFAGFSAHAKPLYVDVSSGNDDTSYSENSESRPWASVGRAVWGSTSRNSPNASQAAQAGDTVIVRAGTYHTTQGVGERYDPIYNPINNGTAGNEITFRADGLVILQSSTSGRGEPIIGAWERQYITWDGFYIDERDVHTKADTGPVTVFGSHHIIIQNLVVRGTTPNWGDNHNAIRLEGATNVLVRNNELFETRGANNMYNGSTIMMYDCSNIIIENNTIHDSQGGIFVKGQHGPLANHNITIRYNLLYNLEVGITHSITAAEGRDFGTRTYQNIIRDSGWGIIFIGATNYTPANVYVVNNTIHNTYAGFFLKPGTAGWSDNIFRNNIVSHSAIAIQGEDITDVRGASFSHNTYFSNDVLARIFYANYTMNGWQSNFDQDLAGSSEADPVFTNATAGDFGLGDASPLRNAGIDVLNLQGTGTTVPINIGAYVTGDEIIGVGGDLVIPPEQPPPVRPEPPTLQ